MAFVLITATATEAAEVFTAPEATSKARLQGFFEGQCGFDIAEHRYRFAAKGQYRSSSFGAAESKGKWKIERSTLVVQARGRGGPCDDPDHCPDTWPDNFRWSKLKLAKGGLLTFDGPWGAMAVLCRPAASCASGAPPNCVETDAIQIRPGHSDTGLFDAVTKAVSAKKFELGAPVALGPRTKNARDTSEVWFVEDAATARHVAKKLEATIGKVKPKEWKWGGPYRVIVIVGKKAAR